MSLFRKPKKSLRARPIEIDDDEEDVEEVEVIQANIVNLKKDKKEKKKKKDKEKEIDGKKKTTLLSFEDEEDGAEEFKIKKSSASRRLVKQKREKNDQSDAELKSSNGNNGNDLNNTAEPIGKAAARPGLKVYDDDVDIMANNKKKQQPTGTSWTLSGREAEALHAEEEEDFNNDEDDELDEDGEDPIQKIIQSGGIPDAAAIHAARKRREALRAKGGKDEFIPLKQTKKKKEEDTAKVGRRLVREEDEEEEEDEERITFTLGDNKEEYHKKIGKGGGSSDEEEGWEAMQIRKAITGQKINEAKEELQNEGWCNGAPATIFNPQPAGVTPGPAPQASLNRPANYDLKGIRDRMKQRCSDLKEVSKRHETDTDRALDDLVTSQSEITRLEEEIPKLAARYKQFQQLRGYFTDLVDCYQEKVGTVAYMESRLNKMYEEHRGKLRERRRQDVRDQADILHAMGSTSVNITFDPVQDAVRDFRVAEREGRQRRRRQARQNAHVLRHNDGLSSDDEMPGQDQAALANVKKDVENQARLVLEDVIEEFSIISNVQERVVDWRLSDEESYKSAYVSLILPKLFSPLIRMQMLFWNPFTSDTSVTDYEWYTTLSTYALNSDETIQGLVQDQDRNLLSLCVEKVVLQKIAEIIRTGYDPVSTGQTGRIVGVLTRLIMDYPTLTMKSKQLRLCFTNVIELTKDSLDQDVYIPMYTKALMEYPHSQHQIFFQRQFYTALKLFKNILAWKELLSESILTELAVDSLLNRYLLLSLRANNDPSDAIDKARLIVECMPEEWLENCKLLSSKMGMLTKFLETAGRTTDLPRDALQEAARLTKRLGDQDVSDSLRLLL